jgi:nucleoside 2-deoxyribosyltransferase
MLLDAIEVEKKIKEKCYIPGRDTNQKQHGNEILHDNFKALKECDDEVFCVWDGHSFGTLFDMGCAYALGKKIFPCSIQIEPNSLGNDKHWNKFFKEKLEAGDTIQFVEKEGDIDR